LKSSFRTDRNAGFTLVEVMIALIVLSVGLLGVAGLEMTGLRANMSSASRTQASYLANDIMDRMRANLDSARNNDYGVTFGGVISGTTVAASDVTAWLAEISLVLPGGQGQIAVDTTTHLATVSVKWVDGHTGCTSAGCMLSFTTVTQL